MVKSMDDISTWVEAHTTALLRYAQARVQANEIAEDLVQDTFLAAAKAIEKFEERSSAKTWLFSILRRKIADHHRKNFRTPFVDSFQVAGEDGDSGFFDSNGKWNLAQKPQAWGMEEESNLLDDPEFRSVLDTCMHQLPSKWYAAMQLKYLEEKDGKDISDFLEISKDNFWQIIHRAKLKMRKCIELKLM